MVLLKERNIMRSFFWLSVCAIGLTLITAFKSPSEVFVTENGMKVSWNIGAGGTMDYLYIDDNFIVGGVTGTGHTFVEVGSVFTDSVRFLADPGYLILHYDTSYYPSTDEFKAEASFFMPE